LPAALSLHFFPLPLLAFAKALCDRRSPGDQRRLVGEALRQVGVIVLHDIEHGFFGKPSMVIGKEFVQVSELFVVHGFRASLLNIPQPVDPAPAFDAIGYPLAANSDGCCSPAAPQSAAGRPAVNHLLTMRA